MRRTLQRELAMKLLYQLEISSDNLEEEVKYFRDLRLIEDAKSDYFDYLYQGVLEHKDELDEIIKARLIKWTLDRITKVDLSILRLAAYELCYNPQIPARVAVSEAVIMCKKFSDERARIFVNAVLGTISRDIEAGRLKIR